jgi:hypothetical protein
MNNGRISLDLDNSHRYDFTDDTPSIYNSNFVSGVKETKTYKQYFSNQNIEYLQDKIIKNVKDCSQGGYDISKQKKDTLLVIMRSIYLQNLKDTGNVQNEVSNMNHLVIEYCVKNIVSNIKNYVHYLNDISKMPIPLEHPKYMRPDGLKKYRTITHF